MFPGVVLRQSLLVVEYRRRQLIGAAGGAAAKLRAGKQRTSGCPAGLVGEVVAPDVAPADGGADGREPGPHRGGEAECLRGANIRPIEGVVELYGARAGVDGAGSARSGGRAGISDAAQYIILGHRWALYGLKRRVIISQAVALPVRHGREVPGVGDRRGRWGLRQVDRDAPRLLLHLERGRVPSRGVERSILGNAGKGVDFGPVLRPGCLISPAGDEPLAVEAELVAAVVLHRAIPAVLAERARAAINAAAGRDRPAHSRHSVAAPAAVVERNLGLHADPARRDLDGDVICGAAALDRRAAWHRSHPALRGHGHRRDCCVRKSREAGDDVHAGAIGRRRIGAATGGIAGGDAVVIKPVGFSGV